MRELSSSAQFYKMSLDFAENMAVPTFAGIIIKTGQGLVILLGCAHRGIVNTILHAQKATGIKEIYAVIGGTHLISAGTEQMQSTIDALKGFNIKKLGASHCTGLKSAAILAHEFEGAFFFNSAGMKTVL